MAKKACSRAPTSWNYCILGRPLGITRKPTKPRWMLSTTVCSSTETCSKRFRQLGRIQAIPPKRVQIDTGNRSEGIAKRHGRNNRTGLGNSQNGQGRLHTAHLPTGSEKGGIGQLDHSSDQHRVHREQRRYTPWVRVLRVQLFKNQRHYAWNTWQRRRLGEQLQ